MATWEITLVYPDEDFEAKREWLAFQFRSPHTALDGVRRRGRGVALTFTISGGVDREDAIGMARQMAHNIFERSHAQAITTLYHQTFPPADPPTLGA